MTGKTPMRRIPYPTRREIVGAALRGAPKVDLAAEHNVSRQRVYELIDEALADTAAAVKEAEQELAYRRLVQELEPEYRARQATRGVGKES